LIECNIRRDNDPEATYLFGKLPEPLRKALSYTRILGRGAFGIVFLAHRKSSGHEIISASAYGGTDTVAVKMVRTVFGAEPLALREGIVQSALQSPLVPTCFDYGISNGLVYMVEELIEDGTSLDKACG